MKSKKEKIHRKHKNSITHVCQTEEKQIENINHYWVLQTIEGRLMMIYYCPYCGEKL